MAKTRGISAQKRVPLLYFLSPRSAIQWKGAQNEILNPTRLRKTGVSLRYFTIKSFRGTYHVLAQMRATVVRMAAFVGKNVSGKTVSFLLEN